MVKPVSLVALSVKLSGDLRTRLQRGGEASRRGRDRGTTTVAGFDHAELMTGPLSARTR